MAVLKYPGLQKYDSEIKSFIDNHYEPKVRFSSTPVFSTTLAEDTTATEANPYEVQFPSGVTNIYVVFETPAMASYSAWISLKVGDVSIDRMGVSSFIDSSAKKHRLLTTRNEGLLRLHFYRAISMSAIAVLGVIPTNGAFVGNALITGFKIWITGLEVLPAGTSITVYAATEA